MIEIRNEYNSPFTLQTVKGQNLNRVGVMPMKVMNMFHTALGGKECYMPSKFVCGESKQERP